MIIGWNCIRIGPVNARGNRFYGNVFIDQSNHVTGPLNFDLSKSAHTNLPSCLEANATSIFEENDNHDMLLRLPLYSASSDYGIVSNCFVLARAPM